MIKEINKTDNGFEVILYDGTVLLFSVHYSGYEDCVNLLLQTISVSGNIDEYKVKEAFVGYDDNTAKFAKEKFKGD